jgi:CRP-like cAMP-binding protein
MEIASLEKILAEHPFFAGLDRRHMDTIVGCAANVTFEAGEFLFRAGEDAARFYVIRHGTVGVELMPPAGEPIVVETVEPGEVLGWSWLFAPYKWHFDARARSFVRALALDGACLRGKCDRDPALAAELLKRFAGVLVSRLEATQLQLMDMYGDLSPAR